MQTTLHATTTANSQHRLMPEQHQAFWIPMLIRPASMASRPSDATTQPITPTPTNDANDPAVADAGDADAKEANDPAVADAGDADAHDLPAELEARRAIEAVELAAEREAKLAVKRELELERKRWADRSAQREATLAARGAASSDEAADAVAKPAAAPTARRGASSLDERGGRGAAILAALALTATAIAILTMPGPAGEPVRASGGEPGLSARPSAGASDLVTELPRTGVRPIAPPIEHVPPAAAAPALVTRDPAPVESAPVAPAAPVEAITAETAPPTLPLTPPETPLISNPGFMDRFDAAGHFLPAGADAERPDGAVAIDAVPASDPAPAVPTSAPRQRSRPAHTRAQPQGMADADALVGTQVIPTSRDLLDVPVDVPADDP